MLFTKPSKIRMEELSLFEVAMHRICEVLAIPIEYWSDRKPPKVPSYLLAPEYSSPPKPRMVTDTLGLNDRKLYWKSCIIATNATLKFAKVETCPNFNSVEQGPVTCGSCGSETSLDTVVGSLVCATSNNKIFLSTNTTAGLLVFTIGISIDKGELRNLTRDGKGMDRLGWTPVKHARPATAEVGNWK